jgi:hypothetical protein
VGSGHGELEPGDWISLLGTAAHSARGSTAQRGYPARVAGTALDPLKVAPKNFALIFENDQVRALRLKVGPHESVPMHEYTLSHLTVCMSDLNARITPAAGEAEVATHKTGDFNWSLASQQKIENLSDQPFETVILEMKTIY